MSLKFFNCLICPFAQRSAIAFDLTLGRNSQNQLPNVKEIEIDLKNKPDYYTKLINPQGKVPSLQTETGKILIESAIITEYILEKFGEDKMFFGSSLEEKAEGKMFAQLFSDLFVGSFYGLMRSSNVQRQEATQKLNDAVVKLNDSLLSLSPNGSYVIGETMGYPDMMCITFLVRLPVVQYYVGYEFPENTQRFQKWVNTCLENDSVRNTSAPLQSLLDAYKGYVSSE